MNAIPKNRPQGDPRRKAGAGRSKRPRAVSVYDLPLSDLIDDQEAWEIDEVPQVDAEDDSPIEIFDDDDIEIDSGGSELDIYFEGAPGRPVQRSAFIKIIEIDGRSHVMVQNLNFPVFAEQMGDIESKVRILKNLGGFIVDVGGELIARALSGRPVAGHGTLSQIDFIELNAEHLCEDSDSLASWISKIVNSECITLPNGATYPISAFFRGSYADHKGDEPELMKFLVGREKLGDKALAEAYLDSTGKVRTRKSEDRYRKRFANIRDYLLKHKVDKAAKGLTYEASARLYLSRHKLQAEEDVVASAAYLLENLKPKWKRRKK